VPPRSGSGYLWHPRAQILSGALESLVWRATFPSVRTHARQAETKLLGLTTYQALIAITPTVARA